MPETPKANPSNELVETDELSKEDSWEEDQEKRGYYYDDSHGYVKYEPEDDDVDESAAARAT